MPFPATFELSSLAAGDGGEGFVLNGASGGDESGWSVSTAGDVNDDGITDLIVGARGADPNGDASGASYVVFGHSVGDSFDAVIDLASLDGSDGFVLNGASGGDKSGWRVGAAGDVNGDGIADLIVAAVGAEPNGSDSGASYVVFGHRAGNSFDAVVDLASLDGSDGFVLNGASNADSSGFSVSAAGDVNGDGIDDLIVGAPGADPNGSNSGASYVVFGHRAGNSFDAVVDLASLDGSDGFVLNGAAGGDNSGGSVSAAGDVNRDGIADLIVGALGAPNGAGSGASYVVFGHSARDPFDAVFELSSLAGGNGSKGFVLNGASSFDASGGSVSAAGDVNGDGIDDLIVGAPAAPNGAGSGASYVVFGHSARDPFDAVFELSSLAGSNGSKGFVINGISGYDLSGVSVSAAGDVNGDGIADLIVGAPGVPNGSLSGVSYVVFGHSAGDPYEAVFELSSLADGGGSQGFIINAASSFDASGGSVSTAGDVNGDGLDDLIVGAMEADPNGDASGASYVVFGRKVPPTVDAAGPVADATPTITGTAVLREDEELAVTVGGRTYTVGDGPLTFTGTAWSLTIPDARALADGTYDVTATITDTRFGTVTSDGTSAELVIDTTTPNRAPVAGNDAYAVDRNHVLAVAAPGLLANDGDEDGDDLHVAGLADGPDHGMLAWTADGGFTYQPDSGFSGTDRFTYQVGDGQGGEDMATVAIRVRGNLPPAPVTGGFGNERLAGTNQAETISGMDGNDTISGDGGRDRLNGNAGDDVVEGGPGEDVVWGGQGNDLVLGGEGSDWVLGDRGDDVVHGGKGRDQVWGGQGHDRLFGDDGDDRLSGDLGNDTLTGGPGADRFVYSEGGGLDRILDHDLMGGDVIELAVGPDGLLNGIAIGSVEDILARLVDGPEGAYLPLGDDQGILIQGIAKGQLSADDFMIG